MNDSGTWKEQEQDSLCGRAVVSVMFSKMWGLAPSLTTGKSEEKKIKRGD